MSNNPETPVERSFAVLPIKNTVLFPGLFLPLSVGRAGSRAAVEAALADRGQDPRRRRPARRRPGTPGLADLYPVGTVASSRRWPAGRKGSRFSSRAADAFGFSRPTRQSRILRASVLPLPPPDGKGEQVEALHRAVLDSASKVIELARPQGDVDVNQMLAQAPSPVQLAYLLASMLSLDVLKEQALLEAESTDTVALQLILDHLTHEVQVLELRNQIASKAQTEMSQGAARLLAPPADAGHPGGTRREDPGEGRGRRAAPPARRGRPARRGPQGGRARAGPARTAAGRGPGLPGHAHVPGAGPGTAVEEDESRARSTWRPPARCSTRTTTAWRRSRSASWSTWRC